MSGKGTPNLAIVGQLLGEPARLAMLQALMSGRALTATELARVASITPATASVHLAKLLDAGLVNVQRQGRYRYHRIANADVADTLERMMVLADRLDAVHLVTGPSDPAMREARVCYDHLAGRVAVAFFDAATAAGWFELSALPDETTGVRLSELGNAGLARLDVSTEAHSRRLACRACLDWSERRHHLAGVIGARLLERCLEQGWVRRERNSRALRLDRCGERALFACAGFN